jgi:DNA primase
VYDAFRNRLMFPILDQSGRIVAFGGRVLEDREGEAKYLNSTETPVFSKGSQLYGLRQGIGAIQQTRRVIVTEGYTDVVACHQAGFANVVATLGTALTQRHAAILRRLCDSVVLLFDGDEAGQRAAERAFEVLFAEPLDVRVAVVPDGLDPDEMLKTETGPAAFGALLDGAVDLHEYRFARLEASVRERGLGVGSAARARVAEEYASRLGELGLLALPPMRQQALVRRLARLGGVGEQAVVQTARRAAAKPGASRAETPDARIGNAEGTFRLGSPAQSVLGCLLIDGSWMQEITGPTRDFWKDRVYADPLAGAIATVVESLGGSAATDTLSRVMRALDDAEARAAAASMAAEVERITESQPDRLRAHFDECLRTLDRQRTGAAQDSPDAPETDTTLDPRIRRIELLRNAHSAHGGNQSAVPRPVV